MTDKGKALLENAYDLNGPDGNRAYYRDMAASYDSDFAQGLGYDYPRAVAAAYQDIAGPDDLPIADIGCGTGLVAQSLDARPIDGMDISDEMLAVATAKAVYRDLFAIDLTADLAPICNAYGAVISAGTFTHGHLGPQTLVALLAIARPGALFVIGVNARHYHAQGFAPVLDDLHMGGRISAPQILTAPIYARTDHDHGQDVANILIFRKT